MVIPYIIIFIFGLAIGSFLNVCIYRIPLNQSIVKPRSHCPKCNALVAWYDNIPLLSYLILRGKCRHCKTPISFRYFIVELLTGILFVIVIWKFDGVNFVSFTYLVVVGSLIALTFIDLDHFIIPDVITYPVMILGVVVSIILVFIPNPTFLISGEMSGPFSAATGKCYPVYNSLFGFAVGGGILWLIGITAKWLIKKEAMGGGDVKLLAALGTFIGYKLVLLTLILASFVGSIIGAFVLIQAKRKEKETTPFGHYIPFGPYLALGAFIALIWGNDIINWYFNHLLGFTELPPGVR
ncbi:MAG: prepilin peptidase [bacterium]|nr:prepilin peptidase [bacterium]